MNNSWLVYPDGSLYPVAIVARRLWGRIEVRPMVPAPDAGITRIVNVNALMGSR